MGTKSKAKNYHHGDLRAALMEGALAIIEEKGIEGLSLREVAREVGVSHAAPYRHFKEKMDLLAALAESGFRELKAALDRAIAKAGPQPEEQLMETGIAYVDYYVSHQQKALLMFGLQFDKKYTTLAQAGGEAFGVILGVVERGQKAGAFRSSSSASEIALGAWSVVQGIAVLYSANRSVFQEAGFKKPNEACRLIGKFLYEGIKR